MKEYTVTLNNFSDKTTFCNEMTASSGSGSVPSRACTCDLMRPQSRNTVFTLSDAEATELLNDSGQASNAILASTFQSQARTAVSAPDTVRLVLLGKEEVTQNLNTDTVFSISRNNGSNFSAVTMAESGTYNSSGVKIYTGTVDVSSQPSGTQLVLKITSVLNKRFTIHGYSLLYK